MQTRPPYFAAAFPEGLGDRLARLVGGKVLPAYLRLCRRFGPVHHCIVPGWWFVLGFEAVREVFARSDAATVANDYKTEKLGWNPPFLLALRKDDENYRQVHACVRSVWSGTRIGTLREIAEDAFVSRLEQLVSVSHRFDAIQDYMIPAFVDIVDRYFGVKIANARDESDFVHSMFVISRFFFGNQKGEAKIEPFAKEAFGQSMRALDEVIARARRNETERRGVLGDLIAASGRDADIRSWLLGMILGFIPTSTNGQGRVLDVLLDRAEARRWADTAVESVGRNDAFLRGCHEALRLNYILPGLFRETSAPLTLRDRKRAVTIPGGATLLVSNQTAMFDPEYFAEPNAFRPDRDPPDGVQYLNYGSNLHYCIGWDISDIVMEETFAALVRAGFSRPRGARREWRGAYPWVSEIEIETAPRRRTIAVQT